LVCGSCLTIIVMFRRTQVWRSKCNSHHWSSFYWLSQPINSGSVRSSIQKKISRATPSSLCIALSTTH
jgi:hypothetical protein